MTPTLPIALAVLAVGVLLLRSHRRIALLLSSFYDRPMPTGFVYFSRYVLGPIFVVVCGVLALIEALVK